LLGKAKVLALRGFRRKKELSYTAFSKKIANNCFSNKKKLLSRLENVALAYIFIYI
jgi:hypothetical protein